MRRRLWLLGLSVVVNLFLAGYIVWQFEGGLRNLYPLLSQRIFAANPNDIIINFTDLRNQLQDIVNREKDTHIGLYFEYLPSGTSINVNGNDEFISASLLKVPFMMGVFKRLESGALREDDVLTLIESDLDKDYGTAWKQGAGAKMTVAEAIKISLTQSDNTVTRALDRQMPVDVVREVYNALDVPIVLKEDEAVVSPKNYSSVFRCLYLSCYLNFASSQKMLDLLTQTKFLDGMVQGVPSSVRVAHKIGIYDSPTNSNRVRLDCGIVYVPHRPYILCILGEAQKGKEDRISNIAKEISEKIYAFVRDAE